MLLDQGDAKIVLNCADVYAAAGRQDKAALLCGNFLERHGEEPSVREYLQNLNSAPSADVMHSDIAEALVPSFVEQRLDSAASIINYAIERFAYTKYLEIGCLDNATFDQIRAPYKVGVDPVSGGTHRMTSDTFFEISDDTFDVIFIDGLHYAEQVYKDVRNALCCLRKNGLIVLHDCRPSEEIHQLRQAKTYVWNGDVWKAFMLFRQESTLDAITADFDHGVGLIRMRPNSAPLSLEKSYLELQWHDYEMHREEWLRLSTEEDIKHWL